MTRIAFAGAEVGSNRVLLESCGVTLISAQWWGYRRRGIPKKGLILADRIPDSMQVIIESGAQRCEDRVSNLQSDSYAMEYWDFVEANLDRGLAFTAWDVSCAIKPPDFLFGHPKYWPVWKVRDGFGQLDWLCEHFPNVAIPNDTIEESTSLAAQTRLLLNKYGTTFHGLGVGKPDNLRQIPFQTATTLAWISPMKRGEVIVWDGTKIARYPKDMRANALPRFRSTAIKAGLDVDLYMEGDHAELSKLAVWSYLQLEARARQGGPMSPQVSDDSDDTLYTGMAEIDLGGSTNRDIAVRNPVTPRDPSEIYALPVFGFQTKTIVDTDETGRDVLREIPVVQSNAGSLRQCDTCFVAANCPAMRPGSTCAFNLPIEVKTKDQLRSLINALLEMQGQRVAFARFTEELNGGYPDPNTGVEMDRFFKILKTMKELDDTSETLKISMERKASGGVLSSIFGDRAQVLRELDNGGLDEEQTTRMITGQLE